MKKKTLEKLFIISFYLLLTTMAYGLTSNACDGASQSIIHLMLCASLVGCLVFGGFWCLEK